jgi:predicted small secreted protein
MMAKHIRALAIALAAAGTLGACNTIEGAGKDLETAGRATTEAAQAAKAPAPAAPAANTRRQDELCGAPGSKSC